MNTTNETPTGKTVANVVFLMAQNPYTDLYEPMAYFPDILWDEDRRNHMSYMHDGQHGPCCEAFALLDCIAPNCKHRKAVAALKKELEGIGYVLTVLDSKAWLESNGNRRLELQETVREITNITDSDAMFEANKRTGESRKARKTA